MVRKCGVAKVLHNKNTPRLSAYFLGGLATGKVAMVTMDNSQSFVFGCGCSGWRGGVVSRKTRSHRFPFENTSPWPPSSIRFSCSYCVRVHYKCSYLTSEIMDSPNTYPPYSIPAVNRAPRKRNNYQCQFILTVRFSVYFIFIFFARVWQYFDSTAR